MGRGYVARGARPPNRFVPNDPRAGGQTPGGPRPALDNDRKSTAATWRGSRSLRPNPGRRPAQTLFDLALHRHHAGAPCAAPRVSPTPRGPRPETSTPCITNAAAPRGRSRALCVAPPAMVATQSVASRSQHLPLTPQQTLSTLKQCALPHPPTTCPRPGRATTHPAHASPHRRIIFSISYASSCASSRLHRPPALVSPENPAFSAPGRLKRWSPNGPLMVTKWSPNHPLMVP